MLNPIQSQTIARLAGVDYDDGAECHTTKEAMFEVNDQGQPVSLLDDLGNDFVVCGSEALVSGNDTEDGKPTMQFRLHVSEI